MRAEDYCRLDESEEECRRRRRRRGIFGWACCCIYIFISLVFVCVLIPVFLIGVANPPPPPLAPCSCNLTLAFDFNIYPFNDIDGRCITHNPSNNGLYVFTGLGIGMEYMINMDISDPLNPILGPNLSPGATHPAGLEEITGCVHFSTHFIVTNRITFNLYNLNNNGNSASIIGGYTLEDDSVIRGLALINETKLYGVDRSYGTLVEFDTTNGSVKTGPVQATLNGDNVILYAIAWDKFTKNTYVSYWKPGQGGPTQRSIGKIDPLTGIIQETCVLPKKGYNSMTFDNSGRLWISTGNGGQDSRKLFFTETAPCVL